MASITQINCLIKSCIVVAVIKNEHNTKKNISNYFENKLLNHKMEILKK